jgi:hypothetical protein
VRASRQKLVLTPIHALDGAFLMPEIQSDILTQQAVDYLNQIANSDMQKAQVMGRAGARAELLNFAWAWYTSARNWRKASYEDDWLKWQRNADGRYDPTLAAKKKNWQAKVFVDLTPSHRENIHAELFRLVAGSRPILDVTARPGGDPQQAENIRDLINWDFEKSRFEVEYNKNLEDKTTYGSGFTRVWFETLTEDRVIKQPITEPVNLLDPSNIRRHLSGQPQIVGYQNVTKPQLIYRGVKVKHINIWDFFPDPKALEIKGNSCLVRSWISLQYILDKVKSGDFMPEAGAVMSQQASLEITPPDKLLVKTERGISDLAPRREGNQKTWEAYELFGRFPQKWIYPLLKEPIPVDDPEKLVPCCVVFNQQTVFEVYLSLDYDGEPPVYKDDYFPVPGRFYGRGIPEMLNNCQTVVNAVVNQRLDEGDLALQNRMAVIEKAVVNPQDLEEGAPGLIVRLNAKALGPDGDARKAIVDLQRPDVQTNAGFNEVHEWERMAADRTSANRVIQGTPRLSDVGTKTLGGMQLLKNQASEKFAFLAMLSEFTYLYQICLAFWKLRYANLTPQDVVNCLGPQRAQTFVPMSPQEIETAYKFQLKGIFEREAKAEIHGRLQAIYEQFKGLPGLNDMSFFDQECKSFNMDPERLKFPDAMQQFLQAKAQQMAEPMAKQMLAQIVIGQAVKDVERNLSEKMADVADGAKAREVAGVPDLGKPDKKEGKEPKEPPK